ncbi:MAG: pro-sigmaK processing inhibitor BofA family protein [Dethiobacter sp.]|nr:pro-sigmaK processing inhibitor BofA family protein [Dethiobacter sp.]
MPDLNVVLAVIFGLIVLYLVARMLVAPARLVLRLLVSAGIGTLVLVVFNLIGGIFGASIGINLATTVIVGFMGLPGLIMLVLLQRMLV